MRALSGGGRPWLKARAGALVMLLKLTPPVVYFSRAAAASTAARTFFSRGGDFGPEHSNCCSKAAFFPSVTVVVMALAFERWAAARCADARSYRPLNSNKQRMKLTVALASLLPDE